MLEDLFDDFLILNKTDDLHPCPLTFGASPGGDARYSLFAGESLLKRDAHEAAFQGEQGV